MDALPHLSYFPWFHLATPDDCWLPLFWVPAPGQAAQPSSTCVTTRTPLPHPSPPAGKQAVQPCPARGHSPQSGDLSWLLYLPASYFPTQ